MEQYNNTLPAQETAAESKKERSAKSSNRKKLIIAVVIIAAIICAATLPGILNSSLAGSDIYDFKLKINGTVYSLPDPVSKFKENGWEFEYAEDGQSTVDAGDYESTTMIFNNNDDIYMEVSVYNPSESSLTMDECLVYCIGAEYDDYFEDEPQIKVELPKGVKLGITNKDSVVSKYGTPTKESGDDEDKKLYYNKKASENPLDIKNNQAGFYFDEGTLTAFIMKCVK